MAKRRSPRKRRWGRTQSVQTPVRVPPGQIQQIGPEPLPIQVENKRVVIASPMMDMCHTTFTSCLVHLIAYTFAATQNVRESFDLTFLQYGTSILPLSRQFLAVKAMECKATHILWIDSDMEFPRDTLIRLARHDHPVVAANCMARRSPFMLTARDESNHQVFTTHDSSGIEKVARVGFGLVWMSTEVLKKMPLPWFNLEWLPEMGIFRGEDYWFCEQAKAAGFDLYIDHDLSKEVKHIGQFGYCPTLKQPADRSETT